MIAKTLITTTPGKVTEIDDTKGTITVDGKKYTLCTKATVYNGDKLVGDSTYDLKNGDTVSLVGPDEAHITSVTLSQ